MRPALRVPTAMLGAFEIVANRALAEDAEALARCAKLAGHSLAIRATDLRLALVVVAVDHGVQLLRWRDDAAVDVSLVGRSTAFAAVARAPGSNIAGSGLQIAGDIGVAQGFAELFATLDVELADWLDRRFGPVPAALVERSVNAGRRFFALAGRELPEQLAEYLVAETGDVVGRDEGRCFADDVSRTRDAVERLAARLEKLPARG